LVENSALMRRGTTFRFWKRWTDHPQRHERPVVSERSGQHAEAKIKSARRLPKLRLARGWK
jgi:hypothetical protein